MLWKNRTSVKIIFDQIGIEEFVISDQEFWNRIKGKDRKKMSAPCAISFCFLILTNDPAMFCFVTLYYSTPRRWTAEKKVPS